METMLLLRLSCFLLLSYVVVVNSTTYPAVEAQAATADAVVVVSLDGTGSYKSIGAAIAAAPLRSPVRHVIHVKKGVYKEYIKITKDMWNIALVGDGMDATIITGDHTASRYNTMNSATVAVRGPGFMARDLRIENTAGASSGQAVALMSESDHSVLYRCSLQGYQDTLYAKRWNQFYRECHISGTVDFIFGDAAAVFQNCKILARLPQRGQANTITAQGRNAANNDPGGFVFQFCTLAADNDLLHANFTVNTYLGRPWRKYSRVVFMQSFMSAVVHPDGWLPWNSTMPLDSLYYAEFKNTGPGAHISGRVHWPGVHSMLGAAEASKFTVQNFIRGNSWLPGTGVTFTPGL